MEGISDIRIIGLDEARPPRILKEPYINLFFKLSHKAPKRWCEEFNDLVGKKGYPAKIDTVAGLFIETWVRKPEEIVDSLDGLKQTVVLASQKYIARIQAETDAAEHSGGATAESAEQARLNKIVAALNFDVED